MGSDSFEEFNPFLFFFASMPFVGYIIFWRSFTNWRKANVLGSRGKSCQGIVIAKSSQSADKNSKWAKVSQFRIKIEYQAYDEHYHETLTLTKTVSNISPILWTDLAEGSMMKMKYDRINPYMADIDDEYKEKKTGCCKQCGYTALALLSAIFFVLIPWWVLADIGMEWYWILIIVILIPSVLMVSSCISCCICCRNHDMIAWYKTRQLQKEWRQDKKEQKNSPYKRMEDR